MEGIATPLSKVEPPSPPGPEAPVDRNGDHAARSGDEPISPELVLIDPVLATRARALLAEAPARRPRPSTRPWPGSAVVLAETAAVGLVETPPNGNGDAPPALIAPPKPERPRPARRRVARPRDLRPPPSVTSWRELRPPPPTPDIVEEAPEEPPAPAPAPEVAPAPAESLRRVRIAGLTSIAALLGLQIWAIVTGYGLRVTSDAPTFVALLRELALHPLQPVSPFLTDPNVETSHATPYMQLLAWFWRAKAGAGDALVDPVGAYHVLGGAGVVAAALLLHAFFLWVRRQADSRAAWLSLPILLVLFGPAHVIWAGDLTFHGMMYAAFYPQTIALAFLLYALVSLEIGSQRLRLAALTVLVAATMVLHPFTGTLLMLLVAVDGGRRAMRRERDWWIGSVALVAGAAVAELWPAYSLDRALAVVGPSGSALVAVCAALPALGLVVSPRRPRLLELAGRAGEQLTGRTPWLLLGGGLVIVLGFAAWQGWSFAQPTTDDMSPADRLAYYWVEDRWRWPLMLAAGAVGLLGLARLVRNGRIIPAVWFGACFAACVGGLAGLPIPVWWRFLLFCQLPLALGLADVLARAQKPLRLALTGTLAFVLAFKLVTLFAVSDEFSYFGSELQPGYALGESIEPGSFGLVATDPFTAYYVPGATGHPVLSVTKAHVGSDAELAASNRGYELLHEFYAGDRWWEAAQEMWRRGVRYVVVEHHTSLAAPTLVEFSTGPTPVVETDQERSQLGSYFYRNNRVGTLIADSPTYAIYRLDEEKLWG